MEAIYEVIAVRHLDFTSKEGERIFGDQVFIKGSAEYGIGWKNDVICERVWIDGLSPRVELKNGYVPTPGDRILCTYNRYGKVNSMALA